MEERMRSMMRAILREDRIARRFVRRRWPGSEELSNVDLRRVVRAWAETASLEELMEALEEERRICYVGMTRARKNLYILADNLRISPFTDEIIKEGYQYELLGNPPSSE